LFEVVGKVNVTPLQIGATCVNVGVVCGFTVTVIVAVEAQALAAGVKVYVVVAVLLIAGDQVPEMLLVDVTGSVNVPPVHIG
jgi:hypothetical protein